MEYLAAGKINLGHAEVLTMCNPEDVNRWLEKATWSTPESLKSSIMNEKPLLERAPFDAKKVCKHCEKRSDEQKDLFGDVQCCYCLDRECFENNVKKEAERIRKNYIADGYEEVPEDDRLDAERGWSGYIDAESDDETDKESIESLMKEGVKPKFWVNDKTAEHGFVYKETEYTDEDSEDNESQNDETLDKDSWDYKIRQMSYDDKKKIKDEANFREKALLVTKLKECFGNINTKAKALILELCDRVYEEDEDCKSYLEAPSYKVEEDFIEEICDIIMDGWSGVEDEYREYLGIESRNSFEIEAYEEMKDEVENLEEKEA